MAFELHIISPCKKGWWDCFWKVLSKFRTLFLHSASSKIATGRHFQNLRSSQAILLLAVCFNLPQGSERGRKHCLSSVFAQNQYLTKGIHCTFCYNRKATIIFPPQTQAYLVSISGETLINGKIVVSLYYDSSSPTIQLHFAAEGYFLKQLRGIHHLDMHMVYLCNTLRF